MSIKPAIADPTAYLVGRIETGNLDYVAVVTKYPQYKDAINAKLIADGFGYLIAPII